MANKKDSDKNKDKNRAKDKLNSENENRCPICLDRISNNCRTDPCNHEFCLGCLGRWTTDHNFCPVCRQVFDRILHNFRGNEFDSIIVDNRQTRVRRSLFTQRDTLRESLTRLRARAEQQLEALRRRLQARERMRNRIDEQLNRINSMDRQNNDEMDQILNEVRNTINEYNYEQFADGMTTPSILEELSRSLSHFPPAIDSIHALPWNESDSSLTVNRNESSSGSMPSLLSASTSNSSGPTSFEWQIHGPNSVGTVSVTSDESDNHSVRSIRSTIVSQSVNDNMSRHPIFGAGPPLTPLSHLSRMPPLPSDMLQLINSFGNEEFQHREHVMDNNFEKFGQLFNSGPAFISMNSNNEGGLRTRFRPNRLNSNNRPNGQISQNAVNFGNLRNRLNANNSILQRNMDWINQFNQRHRNPNQFVNNTNNLSDEIDPGYETDTDD